MAKGEKVIRRRIKSVKSTQQITRAMKMVSSAKLKKSQSATEAAHPYVDSMIRIIDHLVRALPDYEHPFLMRADLPEKETRDVLLLLLTSDKGLCGSFNSNLVREAERFIEDQPGRKVHLFTLGRYGARYFKRRGYLLEDERPAYDFSVHYYHLMGLFKEIEDAFLTGRFCEIWLLYSRFVNPVRQTPTLLKLLPVEHEGLVTALSEEERERKKEEDFIFSPSRMDVLDSMLPRFVRYSVFNAVRENYTSENAARMMAMDNATKNAGEMIDNLTLAYNKARQQAITMELLDIVGGSEALQV
jgi:F-type H+-transporting ATPase subunit gamma